MTKYPYVFFGSAPIGPIALEALELAGYPPTLVLDQPKMPQAEMLELIEAAEPTFFLVVGFGAILKRPILDQVAGQVLNIHPSLLPEFRGPAPVVQAILEGVTETGVTLMEIDQQMDHGPILAQEKLALRGDETASDLYQVLTTKGVHLFLENIEDYLSEKLDLIPQNHADATFSHFITKEQGLLDFSKDPVELEREIRAFQGWPKSWLVFQGKKLIIQKAHLEQDHIRFDLVQPEGGKVMSLEAFCAGKRITTAQFYQQLLDS